MIGIEQIKLKAKQILPQNCILLAFCLLLFFINMIAAIIKAIISIKITIQKNQNKIMTGAFPINNTFLNLYLK